MTPHRRKPPLRKSCVTRVVMDVAMQKYNTLARGELFHSHSGNASHCGASLEGELFHIQNVNFYKKKKKRNLFSKLTCHRRKHTALCLVSLILGRRFTHSTMKCYSLAGMDGWGLVLGEHMISTRPYDCGDTAQTFC